MPIDPNRLGPAAQRQIIRKLSVKHQPKYRNQKEQRIIDGKPVTFDSKKEAARWDELVLLQKAGEIFNLRRQPRYVLIPAQRIDGKLIEQAVRIRCGLRLQDEGRLGDRRGRKGRENAGLHHQAKTHAACAWDQNHRNLKEENMELNYQNACLASEPTQTIPTVVQMTDELNKRIFELHDAATKVTEGLLGERIDLPNGVEGLLPERMKWVFESLFRITDALKRSGEFVGG